MRNLSPVVWSEGMHLAQHHFQLQNRYFEDSTAFALDTLFSSPWGLVTCELDTEALLNGTVSVLRLQAVFPDGTAVQIPEDPAPTPLEIRERFSPTRESHVVMLTVPAYRPEGPNIGADSGDHRYRKGEVEVVDDTSGSSSARVTVGLKNLRLCLDVDANEDDVQLPLARVRRDGTGRFIYDPSYVAPSLQIRGSTGLIGRLRRIVDGLEEKTRVLAATRGSQVGDHASYAGSDIAGFWFSHALHSALPPLRHHLATRTGHPEELYLELARLGGALCTFTATATVADLPSYDHLDLESTFDRLDRHIRSNLDVVLPAGAVTVPLEPLEPYFLKGTVADRRCLAPDAEWWLVIRPEGPAPDLSAKAPRLAKICSAKHIVRLVREAYPGMSLTHVESPPSALSPRVGHRYFRVERTDPCWKSVVDTAEIGLYTPQALGPARYEFAILLES
jgi:type VI secretion system protein ImpJ